MKKLMFAAVAVAVGSMITGCATNGLSDDAQKNVQTALWYENATLLVDANDPDLKADATTAIPAIDGAINGVKDLIATVPSWTVAKVEEKHFKNMYMESAKALNGGADGADLVVKGEAFKTALLMDTFAGEVAHSKAALGLAKDARLANYAKNGEVYENAVNKTVEYGNNQVFAFESCADDAARKAFFADASRKQWDAKCDEFTKKLMACVAKADNEETAKAGVEKLCKEMGVQSVDWKSVALKLQEDLAKLQSAAQAIVVALQNPDLAAKIAAASFGAEIVPGTSGKETLAAINRAQKQLQVSIRLVGWLIKAVAV